MGFRSVYTDSENTASNVHINQFKSIRAPLHCHFIHDGRFLLSLFLIDSYSFQYFVTDSARKIKSNWERKEGHRKREIWADLAGALAEKLLLTQVEIAI